MNSAQAAALRDAVAQAQAQGFHIDGAGVYEDGTPWVSLSDGGAETGPLLDAVALAQVAQRLIVGNLEDNMTAIAEAILALGPVDGLRELRDCITMALDAGMDDEAPAEWGK